MGLDMDALVDLGLSLLALVVAACVINTVRNVFVEKKKTDATHSADMQQPLAPPTPEQKRPKTTLDVVTTVTNVILSVLYVPFGLFSFFGMFMADNPPDSFLGALLVYAAVILFMLTPVFCVAGIVLSVTLRRAGKSEHSFAAQFLPIGSFLVGVLLLLLGNLFA